MKENPRLKAALEETERKKGEPLTEQEAFRVYVAQFLKDRKAGQLDEYDPEEIAELAEFVSGTLQQTYKDDMEQLAKVEKRRTSSDARKVGAINKLPTAIAMPTFERFKYSMSLYQEGNAYLQPFTSTDGLKFKGGKLYFDTGERMREISEVELQNLKTKEGIESIDLPFLRIFYSIVLQQFERTKCKELKDFITLYIPDLAEVLGQQRNLNKEKTERIINAVQSFHNIVGVMDVVKPNGKTDTAYYQVLNFEYYDPRKNTITFSSPYMNYLISTVYDVAIKRDKNGKPKLKASGEPLRLATHSYLIPSEINAERNKEAVENVFIIVQLIEDAGNNIPRIKASTLIERNPQLQERLEYSKNKRQLLKRNFSKTWELLRSKTRLAEVYDGIELPDPNDPRYLPNETELENLVISFPHNGKKTKK